MAGKVLQVGANGTIRTVKQLKQGTADLAYVPGSKTVIVPNMNENNVAAYDLAGALQ